MNFTLYKHQRKQNKALRKGLKHDNHLLYYAPTGWGKSVGLWDLIRTDMEKGLKVLVLAPRRSLVFQLEDTFRLHTPHLMMGSIDRGSRDSGLILSSIQTTNSKLKRGSIMYENIDKIYLDEVHIGGNFPPPENSVFDLLYKKYWGTAKWVGVTATPITAEGYRLGGWDGTVGALQTGDLIEMGYLSEFKYLAPSSLDTSQLRINKSTHEYDVSDIEEAVTDSATLGSVKKQLIKHYRTGTKCIIFCITIDHAELLRKELDIDSFIIHSKMTDSEQRKTLEDFKKAHTGVLINVAMLTTGFDDKTVNLLILARPIRTVRLAIQVWGRGLRLNGDKVCTILDMCSVHESCGLPDDYRDFNRVKNVTDERAKPTLTDGKLCEICGEQSEAKLWKIKRKVKKRCILVYMTCPACDGIMEKRTDFKKVSKLSEIISHRKHIQGLREASEGIKTLSYAKRKPLVYELVERCTSASPKMSHYVITEINKAKLGKMLDYVLLNYKRGNLIPVEAWKGCDKLWQESKRILNK